MDKNYAENLVLTQELQRKWQRNAFLVCCVGDTFTLFVRIYQDLPCLNMILSVELQINCFLDGL
jgi:hypothetical protein